MLLNKTAGGTSRTTPWSGRRWLVSGESGFGGPRVIGIAASLFGTTVVTATLGFAFWAVGAHFTTAEVIGRSAAAISAMQFIATFATLGLQTLLIAELPDYDGPGVRRLVTTSLEIVFAAAFCIAAGYSVVHRFIAAPEWLYSTYAGVVIFGIGTAVTTVTIVLDGAVIGVSQSRRQVTRNLVFAVVKLVALPVAALTVGLSPPAIFLVWLLGNLVSLATLGMGTQAFRQWVRTTPSIRGFLPLWRTAAGHHWVNVATYAPRLALPVLVAAQVSDRANAGFYAALLLVSFVWIIPNHLATGMFALNSGDPEQFRAGLDTALRLSAVLSVLAAISAPILSGPLLRIFGPGYDDARDCLTVLTVCTFAGAVKSIYVAVRRVQGALGTAARTAALGAALELGAVELGVKLAGVTGVGLGLGAAMIIEAVFFWPTIARARRQRVAPKGIPEQRFPRQRGLRRNETDNRDRLGWSYDTTGGPRCAGTGGP